MSSAGSGMSCGLSSPSAKGEPCFLSASQRENRVQVTFCRDVPRAFVPPRSRCGDRGRPQRAAPGRIAASQRADSPAVWPSWQPPRQQRCLTLRVIPGGLNAAFPLDPAAPTRVAGSWEGAGLREQPSSCMAADRGGGGLGRLLRDGAEANGAKPRHSSPHAGLRAPPRCALAVLRFGPRGQRPPPIARRRHLCTPIALMSPSPDSCGRRGNAMKRGSLRLISEEYIEFLPRGEDAGAGVIIFRSPPLLGMSSA